MSTQHTYETVKVEREDGIGWVTFNRPEKRNATNPTMHREMNLVLDELEFDDDVRVVVFTGAGDSWCAGQDLREFFRDNDDDPVARRRARQDSHSWTWERLFLFPKPTIAMVNGYCFGNAFTPLIACDFAIASETATFGLSEVNWGIFPGGLVSRVVADALSYRDAMLYVMTGRSFTGKQAAEMRLVTFAVPAERLRDETVSFAQELLARNPNVLRAAKEVFKTCRTMDYWQAYEYMTAKSSALRATDAEGGRQKGMRQFLDEKSYRPGLGAYKRDA